MALVFKVNGTTIYPIVNTTITERVGTFSDGSLPLEITNVRECFLPMSKLTIEDTVTNSKWLYIILADDVERVAKNQTYSYRHNLSIRSGIYESTKHILRNTVFSQPNRRVRLLANQMVAMPELYTDNAPFYFPENESGKDNYSHIDLKVNRRTKFASGVLKISTTLWEYSQDDTDYESPNKYKNTHRLITVYINRYDNGTYVDGYSVQFATGSIDRNISMNHAIFRNISDETVYRISFGSTVNFNPQNYYNIGALAYINVELELQTYYYSMYDAVNTLYKQSRKLYNADYSKELECLRMVDADKIAELDNIIAPEISFNGMSYYDALYQLLSYIDAIPVVDANGNLTYEYLNNNNGALVDVNTKKADERISINDEYYTNKIVANYQNGRQENAICYPSVSHKCRVTTKSLGIPESSSSYILKVPKPIDYIDKLVITTGTLHFAVIFRYERGEYHLSQKYDGLLITELEMQDRTLESVVYNALNNNQEFYEETRLLDNCLCYTRGADYVDLLGESSLTILTHEVYRYAIMSQLSFQIGIPSNSTIAKYDGDAVVEIDNMEGIDSVERDICDKQDIYFKIEYHAIFDGRVEQASSKEKYDGETFVNQESGQVSLNRMGNNLQGLIAKVGNKTENITFDVSSYGSRVKLGSIWVNDDNERYLANVVQTTFSTDIDKVIVNAQFTKDFNLLAQYTKIDQQKRFYQISNLLTTKGYENITEYVYFSYEAPYNSSYESSAITNSGFLLTLIGDTLRATNQENKVTYATFKPYTYENDNASAINGYVYIPLHCYGSGNSICFEMDYDDSLNAGNRLTGNSSYFTKATLYTESNGFADVVDIAIWDDYGYSSDDNYSENFPIISSISNPKMIDIQGFHYYKKPNEIFHINYGIAFMSDEDCEFFFGDKFINNNAVIVNSKLSSQVRFNYGDKLYSIIDNKGINSSTIDCTISASISILNDKKYVAVTITLGSAIDCKSWALVDENNNVLVASNKTYENVSSITFYVIPRRNRI